MVTFIAQRIIEASEISLAKGQDKYRAYFGSTAVQRLYGRYQADVDAILRIEGHEDCIVQ